MKRPIHIRIISACMLLLFAFSITPKQFLHDMFAGHTDMHQSQDHTLPFRADKAGFHCDKDGLVATSPFVAEEPTISVFIFVSFSLYTPGQESLSSVHTIYYPLRGPPSVNMLS